jgi:hypothetical protein
MAGERGEQPVVPIFKMAIRVQRNADRPVRNP